MKLPEDDWLVKHNSFLTGGFIFMLNTDWMAKKQLYVNSISHLIQSISRSDRYKIFCKEEAL